MPAAIVTALASKLLETVITSVFLRSLIAAAIGFVVKGLVSGALGGKKKAEDPVVTAKGRTITIRQPASPRQVIFGEVRVGGVLTFVHVENVYLHMVITLAGHRSAAIGEVFFNDERITIDADGFGTGRWAEHLLVKKSLGDESGQPFPALVSETNSVWSNSHRQAGCTKLYVRLKANPELFPGGVPNVSAVVRGALYYDPRTGSTGWSNNAVLAAAHYLSDTGYGMGAHVIDEFDADTRAAAANIADERVPLSQTSVAFTADADTDVVTLAAGSRVPITGEGVLLSSTGVLPGGLSATVYYAIRDASGGLKLATSVANALAGTAVDITGPGTGTHALACYDEARYTANGAFLTSAEPKTVLGLLLGACAGQAVHSGGRWHLFAGAYEVPTIELSESDFAGPMQAQTHVTRRENANGVKGLFTNPGAHWQPDDFPAIASDAYMAEDGGERVWKDLDFSAFVTSGGQAQRLAKIELLSLRQGFSAEISFKLTAWRAMTGRTVGLTFSKWGISNKPCHVVESRFELQEGGALGVRLSLRETAAAVFDWATSEEQAVDLAPNTTLPTPGSVGAPGVPSVTEELYETRDGRGVAVKAIVSWGESSYPYGTHYQLEYKLASAPATGYTVLPVTRDTSFELLDLASDIYDFRVMAVSVVNGATSDYAELNDKEIVGLGAAPAAPTIRGLQAVGGTAILTLDRHPDLDVRRGGRWRIRHCHEGVTASWEAAFSIGEEQGYVADQTILVLPLKPGTYLVKSEDSTGNPSEDWAEIETKQASLLAFTTLATVTEDSAFGGSHSGTATSGGVLTLGGAGLFDDIPDLDAVSDLDGYGGLAFDGTYSFAAGIDLGSVKRVRLTGRIEGTVVNLLDLIDERSGNIDDWDDFDGDNPAIGSAADAWIEARETDDNPAASPTWSDWKRLDASEFIARAFQMRARLTTTDPAYRPEITVLRVTAEEMT